MDSVRKTSEMESTAGILADNFKLSVEEAREKALTDIGEGALKKEEILLAQKIEDLGPVNLAAEEDYQAAKERYEFLTKQYDDMVTAKKQLELVISGINSDMTKRFREAFDKINEYFGKCYEKLFGGGKARLVIQNEENLLETGIDIEAQPPGKKMRNLSLFLAGSGPLPSLPCFLLFFPIIRRLLSSLMKSTRLLTKPISIVLLSSFGTMENGPNLSSSPIVKARWKLRTRCTASP